MNHFEDQQSRIEQALKLSKQDKSLTYSFLLILIVGYFSIVFYLHYLQVSLFTGLISRALSLLLFVGLSYAFHAARLHWKYNLPWEDIVPAFRYQSRESYRLLEAGRADRKRKGRKALFYLAALCVLFVIYAVIKDRYFR